MCLAEFFIAFFGNGKVFNLDFLKLIGRIIIDNDLNGIKHSHYAVAVCVQILSDAVLEHSGIYQRIGFRHACTLKKIFDSLGRIALSAHSAKGWHPRIIPAVNIMPLNKGAQETLAHDSI